MKKYIINKAKETLHGIDYRLPSFAGRGLGVGLLALLMASCSDWDDHYDADTAISSSQQTSLMENITNKPELSQFAALLNKVGFNEQLNASQTYTVWAPVNDSFNYDELMATNNDRLLNQFVKNHIARNNYPASGLLDQKVFMLNEKLTHFRGAAPQYNIQDIPLNADQQNIGSRNGILHLLDGKIPFLPNIYESLNNEDYPLDLISKYYENYVESKLDESQSVPGPIVDGEQTYLDSIVNESNTLFKTYRAYINQEDSNYTMLMPTNTAWTKAYNRVSQYYNYIPSFKYVSATDTGADTIITVTLKDAAQLRDSITKYKMMSDLFFNNNLHDNQRLEALKEGEVPANDSLVSTMSNILYGDDIKGLFTDAKRVDKSNGAIWVTDTLNLPAWSSWNPEITIEAESYAYKYVFAGTTRIQRISTGQNTDIKGHISNNAYLEVNPNSPGDKPEVYFFLPNVRSTEYNVYVVMLPSNIVNKSAEYKRNSISAGLRYAKEDGTLVSESNQQNTSPSEVESGTTFVTKEEACIDTLCLGSVTFPVAYFGTGESMPYLHIRTRYSSAVGAAISPDHSMRIDCIILRPKELDDYLQSHPGYVYDKHNDN